MAPMAPMMGRAAPNSGGYMWWGLVLLFAGAALGVLGKKMLYHDLLTTIGVLMSLLGMFLIVLPLFRPPARTRT